MYRKGKKATKKIIPFSSPLPPHRVKDSRQTIIQYLCTILPPNTEKTDPFDSHNTPYAYSKTSPPFTGRLRILPSPCHKNNRKSHAAQHNSIFHTSSDDPNLLLIYTDGSRYSHKGNKKAGYGVVGIYLRRVAFSFTIPLSKGASVFNDEMHTLAHASTHIKKFLTFCPHISEVKIYSDSSSSIQMIFDGSPHPSQQASILFRSNMLTLFNTLPHLRVTVQWTPGHCGVVGQVMADKAAKSSVKKKGQLLNFTTKSFVKEQQKLDMKKRWKEEWDECKIATTSRFYVASQFIRPNTKPDAIFKTTPQEPFSRLTQTLTGHGYTGKYYHCFHINNHPHECDCPLPGPILQTHNHIIRECPNFKNRKSILWKKFPRLENPRFQLASILKRNNYQDMKFLNFYLDQFYAPSLNNFLSLH